MNKNTLVAPLEHGDKAPIKKSTLLGILVTVVIVFVIGAAVGANSKSNRQAAKAAAPDESQKSEGKPGSGRDVDDEFASAPPTPTPLPVPLPLPAKDPVEKRAAVLVPENVRRTSNGAAVENTFDPEAERQKAALERIARADASKLVVFDVSGDSAKGGGQTNAGIDFNKKPSSPMELMAMIDAKAREASQDPETARSKALADQLELRNQMEAAASTGAVKNSGYAQNKAEMWLGQGTGAKQRVRTLYPHAPTGKYVLTQGKTIPAVLLRSLNTDLPCEISARSLVDVYDSLVGDALLLPAGSEFVGKCSSSINAGQTRILFAFQRVILPNGKSFLLPNAMGMDKTGASGLDADVNNHFLKMFASSFFVAFLADRAERKVPQNNSLIGGGGGGARSAAGEVLVDVSRTILDRNKTIQPTLTVDAGARFNVNVAADMDFLQPYTN